MVRLILTALLGILLFPAFAHGQDAPPLNETELREVLSRLKELKIDREKLKQEEAFIERDRQQDAREAALNAKALELAQKEKDEVEKERDHWKERTDYYQHAYEVLAKKRGGFGCTMKHIFTLWLASCGG